MAARSRRQGGVTGGGVLVGWRRLQEEELVGENEKNKIQINMEMIKDLLMQYVAECLFQEAQRPCTQQR